jgi:hypothetical protein
MLYSELECKKKLEKMRTVEGNKKYTDKRKEKRKEM